METKDYYSKMRQLQKDCEADIIALTNSAPNKEVSLEDLDDQVIIHYDNCGGEQFPDVVNKVFIGDDGQLYLSCYPINEHGVVDETDLETYPLSTYQAIPMIDMIGLYEGVSEALASLNK